MTAPVIVIARSTATKQSRSDSATRSETSTSRRVTMRRMGEDAPLRSLLITRGGGRSQMSDAPPSPQSSNLRVGSQLPFHIVTAGPEDDASGAPGLERGETFAQLLVSACEGHLFGGGYVDERVMAVRNVEGMTAVNGEVAGRFRPRVRRWPATLRRSAALSRFPDRSCT